MNDARRNFDDMRYVRTGAIFYNVAAVKGSDPLNFSEPVFTNKVNSFLEY